MLKGLCAVAAALTMSCVASADAGETPPDHQYFPGTDPWTTPDFHLPKKREWPDGPNKEFLKNLQRPDNYKNPWRDKHCWYALINGQWKPVPPDKIVPSYAPDGQAFLFMAADVILCFVRPKGGL
jgi:hypothetical protein